MISMLIKCRCALRLSKCKTFVQIIFFLIVRFQFLASRLVFDLVDNGCHVGHLVSQNVRQVVAQGLPVSQQQLTCSIAQ